MCAGCGPLPEVSRAPDPEGSHRSEAPAAMGSGLPKPLPPHAATSGSKPRDSKPCRATSPRLASRSRSRSEDIVADVAGNRVSRAARGDSAARAAGGWAALAVGLNGLPGFDAA